MNTSIFRKSSLEKISGPEQLNDYIKVTHPNMWVLLMGLFSVLAGAGVWLFQGSIPETVGLNGIAFSREGPVQMVYGYARMREAKRLRVGMPAQVSPDYAPRDKYGFVYGKVARIGERPVSDAQLIETFGEPDTVKDFLPKEGKAVEILVQLDSSDGGLRWSHHKGEAVRISSGSECTLQIITRERKPYELVFNR